MSILMRDVGKSTRVCFAVTALRIRVSMSAIGSVISDSLSPAALRHPCHIALERELAKAQAAQPELPHVGARTAAQVAAVAQAYLVFRCLQLFRGLCCRGHSQLSSAGTAFP